VSKSLFIFFINLIKWFYSCYIDIVLVLVEYDRKTEFVEFKGVPLILNFILIFIIVNKISI